MNRIELSAHEALAVRAFCPHLMFDHRHEVNQRVTLQYEHEATRQRAMTQLAVAIINITDAHGADRIPRHEIVLRDRTNLLRVLASIAGMTHEQFEAFIRRLNQETRKRI